MIEEGIERFVQILRDLAPKDTGNLAYNAIRYEHISPGVYKIYIETEGDHRVGALDGIAPYQVFLNENTTLRNGAPNKHYKWWEAAIELALEELANIIQGEIE